MVQARIGIFDSGLGGLTVARVLRDQLPDAPIVYFADSGRCPYGPRPAMQVRTFSLEILDLLAGYDVALTIVACNTATAALAQPEWPHEYTFPVLGVIEPGARAAVAATQNGRIGLLTTEGTMRSGAYERAIHRLRPEAMVCGQGAPKLVTAVEAGLGQRDPRVIAAVREYVAPLVGQGIDTLVLGCTHFPHLAGIIGEIAGPTVTVVDPAGETARQAKALLASGLDAATTERTDSDAAAMVRSPAAADLFLTSGDAGTFCRLAGTFWPGVVTQCQHIEMAAS